MSNAERVIAEFEKHAAGPYPKEELAAARKAVMEVPGLMDITLAEGSPTYRKQPLLFYQTRMARELPKGMRGKRIAKNFGGHYLGATVGNVLGALGGEALGDAAQGKGMGGMAGSFIGYDGVGLGTHRDVAAHLLLKRNREAAAVAARRVRTAGKIGLGVAGAGAAALLAKKLLSSGDED